MAEICLFAKFAKFLARWQQRDIQNSCYLSELWVPGCPKYPAEIDVTQNRWQKRGQRSWVLPLNRLACRAEDHGLGQTMKTNVILSPNLIASMMIEISKTHLSEFLDFIPSSWILLFVQWDVSCVYIFTEPAFEDESKPLFEDFLKKRGIEYWPTVANFIFCYFSEPVRLDAGTEVVLLVGFLCWLLVGLVFGFYWWISFVSLFLSWSVGGSIRFYGYLASVDDLYGCFWLFPW